MNTTTLEQELADLLKQQNAAIITLGQELAQIKNEINNIKKNHNPAILEFYEIKLADYGAKQKLTTPHSPCLHPGKTSRLAPSRHKTK